MDSEMLRVEVGYGWSAGAPPSIAKFATNGRMARGKKALEWDDEGWDARSGRVVRGWDARNVNATDSWGIPPWCIAQLNWTERGIRAFPEKKIPGYRTQARKESNLHLPVTLQSQETIWAECRSSVHRAYLYRVLNHIRSHSPKQDSIWWDACPLTRRIFIVSGEVHFPTNEIERSGRGYAQWGEPIVDPCPQIRASSHTLWKGTYEMGVTCLSHRSYFERGYPAE
ncbi:hypothetical protein DFH09DRAFT_1093518 [Mycena vulgaris]|nr:hypothetical protein DFH09DRAFT_1093518 [Mycena vulgaris]